MPVVDPHLVWACGHGIVLLCAVYILLQTLMFRGTPLRIYKFGFTGALLSYSIVVFKSLGRPQPTLAWIQRAFPDENVQYAVLALYWWISKPVSLSIVPFATFSLFHCLTFLRTNVLPKFIPAQPAQTPQGPGAAGGRRPGAAGQDPYSQKIQVWVKNNYDGAMRFVAYAELVILARVVLSAITFQGSFLTPLFLAHFIRMRYHNSLFTRQAVKNLTARIDDLAGNRGGAISNGWETVKRLIGTWGGGNLMPSQAQAQAGQAGQGGAAAAAAARERRNQ